MYDARDPSTKRSVRGLKTQISNVSNSRRDSQQSKMRASHLFNKKPKENLNFEDSESNASIEELENPENGFDMDPPDLNGGLSRHSKHLQDSTHNSRADSGRDVSGPEKTTQKKMSIFNNKVISDNIKP